MSAALALLLLIPAADAPAMKETEDERVLREAGVGTDGPALLRYFRDRTLDARDRDRLANLVKQLGARSFAAREKATQALLAAGDNALPFLKPALADRDPEVARRARQCLDELEKQSQATLKSAAARLLARRRPDGAAEALLAFAPFADREAIGEAVFEALAVVGIEGTGKKREPAAVVVKAAADPDAGCRAAAAFVLGHCPGQNRAVAPLTADPDSFVRYHAGLALVRLGDPAAVPVLVRLLGDAPIELAWRAEELLTHIAAGQAPTAGLPTADDAALRKKVVAAWEGWYTAHGRKVDLAQLRLDDLSLGLTLVCEVDGVGQFPGRACEFDRSGNLRWKIEGLDSPGDVQRLPGGRVLVAEHWAGQVTERDRDGKTVWKHKTADKPVSCQRLPGGNTFIATYTELLEVTPAGKTVYNHKVAGMIYCGYKQRNGRILSVNSSGLVREIEADGKEVLSFTAADGNGAAYWSSVERLAEDRFLVCLSGSGRVLETDRTGKVLWECNVPSCGWAMRLRNGNTLVCNVDGKTVVEVDKKGKEVWQRKTQGRPFCARRY